MTVRFWPGVLLAMAIPLAAPSATEACSCGSSSPPCQAAWAADAIFSGTVRSIDVSERFNADRQVLEAVIRFDVEQRFLNVSSGPVEIVTDQLSTCSYRFARGEKYVVYARRLEDGRFTASVCSRTRPLAEAADDVKYLSALPAAGTGARVYGRINEWVHHPADAQGVDHGPLENITVSVSGAGLVRDLVTDRNGEYELRGLPLGAVTISVATPFGFTRERPRQFEVADLRACIAADFTLRAESAAHGLVVDDAGRPLSGILVEAVAAELAGYTPDAIFDPATTDARGRFAFDYLPPGIYVFGVNVTKGRYRAPSGPATFLPGTAAVKHAAVVELKPGERADVGVLRLTSR
jgi:hypothetical protein